MDDKKQRQYGAYIKIMKEPETSTEMRDVLKKAICALLDKEFIDQHVPDWNTLQFIIHEGIEIVGDDLSWYGEEKEGYQPAVPMWQMTVAIKYLTADPE